MVRTSQWSDGQDEVRLCLGRQRGKKTQCAAAQNDEKKEQTCRARRPLHLLFVPDLHCFGHWRWEVVVNTLHDLRSISLYRIRPGFTTLFYFVTRGTADCGPECFIIVAHSIFFFWNLARHFREQQMPLFFFFITSGFSRFTNYFCLFSFYQVIYSRRVSFILY